LLCTGYIDERIVVVLEITRLNISPPQLFFP